MAEPMTKLKHTSHREGAQEHRQGNVAHSIEAQTAKMSSDVWLWAAFAAIGVSMLFHGTGREKTAIWSDSGSRPSCCSVCTISWSKSACLIALLKSVTSSQSRLGHQYGLLTYGNLMAHQILTH